MVSRPLKKLFFSKLKLSIFILTAVVAGQTALSAEEMESSLLLKKIDDIYAQRDQAGALKTGESLCDQALTTPPQG